MATIDATLARWSVGGTGTDARRFVLPAFGRVLVLGRGADDPVVFASAPPPKDPADGADPVDVCDDGPSDKPPVDPVGEPGVTAAGGGSTDRPATCVDRAVVGVSIGGGVTTCLPSDAVRRTSVEGVTTT